MVKTRHLYKIENLPHCELNDPNIEVLVIFPESIKLRKRYDLSGVSINSEQNLL